MHRNSALLLIILSLLAALAPAIAQEPDGFADYPLNLRAGPGTTYHVIAVLDPGSGLILEARTADLAWLLGHTADGAYRGWVASLYVRYRDGFGSPARLPVSDEIIAYQPPVAAIAPADPGIGTAPDIDAATAQLLASVPVIPAIGPRAYEIFARGQALGNNPRVFTQVGECNIMSQAFMVPFGSGAYDLGPYPNLQATIDFFSASPVEGIGSSFWYKGIAMQTGLTSLVVVDPTFNDPAVCPPDKTLLECEYDRSRPSVAIIHLGLYDVYWLTPAQYESSMRRIVEISIARGVIPVLTTFPTAPGDVVNWPNDAATRHQNRTLFNRTVINLGREYGVPVINLWRATQPLPGQGLKPGENDYQHVSETWQPGYFISFKGEETQFGFTMWNLITLQTLDALRIGALGG